MCCGCCEIVLCGMCSISRTSCCSGCVGFPGKRNELDVVMYVLYGSYSISHNSWEACHGRCNGLVTFSSLLWRSIWCRCCVAALRNRCRAVMFGCVCMCHFVLRCIALLCSSICRQVQHFRSVLHSSSYNTSLQRSVPALLHNTVLQNLSVFRKRRKFNARHKIHITKIAIINSSRSWSWRHSDDSRKSVVEECCREECRIPSVGKEFHRDVLQNRFIEKCLHRCYDDQTELL